MRPKASLKFSVIIPVYNEEGNIGKLVKEIIPVMKSLRSSYEIIIVDDGSTDGTAQALSKIPGIKIIKFRKNFGQSAALDAGIKESKGKVIITLDGDGQNDPADIPKLVDKLQSGFDAVCGWRYKRKDSWSKIFISNVARGLRSILVSDRVHDAGCTLRIYKRECFEDLDLRGEMHRMIPAMLVWRGYKITEVKVNHRPRTSGESKYGYARALHGFLDMLLIWFTRKYSSRPLHLFGGIGLFFVIVSFLISSYVLYESVINDQFPDRIWAQATFLTFFAGLQLFVSGILADLILKTGNKSRGWMIKDVTET